MRLGLVFSLALGAAFVWMNRQDLPVNFQIDGQVPEYLAWSVAPETSGNSLNPELNRRLYSFYYAGLGVLAHLMGRMELLYLVYTLEILAVAAAVFYFVATLTRDRWAALLAVAVVVWHDGTAVALGGSGGIGLICGAEHPAMAMALVALALSWRRQHIPAAFVAGLSFNMHGSSAIFVSAMIFFAACADALRRPPDPRGRRALQLLATALVGIAAASPTAIWILLNPPPGSAMTTAEWLRFPHWVYSLHMLISTTSGRAWTMLFLFVLPGILGLAARRDLWREQRSLMVGWIIASALLLAVGYVFVELIPVRVVAQLTLWRGTRNLVMLCLAFGLSHLVRCVREGGWAAIAAALTLIAFVTPRYPELAFFGHVGLIGLLLLAARRVHGGDRYLAVAALLSVVAVVAFEASALALLTDYLLWRWPLAILALMLIFMVAGRTRESWTLPAATVCGMVVITLWLTDIGMFRHFPNDYRRRAAALLELAPAVERACPPGQIVIAPPDLRNPGAWANRGSFLCRQQLTAYAYGPWLAEQILERMRWYLDLPIEQLPPDEYLVPRLCEGYRRRSDADFAVLRDNYGVRLAIVERGQTLAFEKIAQNDEFSVYDLERPL